MPLLTERLLLRDFALTDWDALGAILSDPCVTRFMHFSSWGEEQRRAWLMQIVRKRKTPTEMRTTGP